MEDNEDMRSRESLIYKARGVMRYGLTMCGYRLCFGLIGPREEVELVLCIVKDRRRIRLRLGRQGVCAAALFSGFEDKGTAVEGLVGGFAVGAHAHELVLHPSLQFGHFGKTVGYLEPL